MISRTDPVILVTDRKGLAVAVTHVDAVELGPHPSPIACRSASRQHCQHGKKTYHQLFHGCKGTNKPPNCQIFELRGKMITESPDPRYVFSMWKITISNSELL